MKTTKRLLSVLLSLAIIFTSLSVGFIVDAAMSNETSIALRDAVKSATVRNIPTGLMSSSTTGSGNDRRGTNATVINLATYAQYKEMRDLLILIDTAVKETNEWVKADFQGDASARLCTDAEMIQAEIRGSLLSAGLQESEWNSVSHFFNYIFTMNLAVTHAGNTGTQRNVRSRVYNQVTVQTSDYKGYLAEIGKESNVESSISLGHMYKFVMTRENYKTGFLGMTNHYHNAVNINTEPINAPSVVTSNTAVKAELNTYVNYLNSCHATTFEDLLANPGNIDSMVTEFNTKRNNMISYVGGEGTYNSLFADYLAGNANFLASCQSAKDFQNYLPTVDSWNAFANANPAYGTFNYGAFGEKGSATQVQLVNDFNTFNLYYETLAAGGDIFDYLCNHNYIDVNYYTNFYDNVVVYNLQDTADVAANLYNTYNANYEELTPDEQSVVYSELCGYINAIGTYSAQVKTAVYPAGYENLVVLREALKCELNPAVVYFAEYAHQSFLDYKTEDVWTEIETAKATQIDLDNLYAEVASNIGTAEADILLAGIRNDAAAMIDGLYTLLGNRFTAQVTNAYDVYEELGKPTELTVASFLQLSAVLTKLEHDIRTDLDAAGQGSKISAQTIAEYNEIMAVGGIYEIWDAYAKTFGFADYEQTHLDYETRGIYPNDKLRTEEYVVTEDKLLNTISSLDKILVSDTFANLIGQEDFDLGTLATDAVKDLLFTDEMINTIVYLLYPIVVTEFEKVWADLPLTINYSGMNITVNYLKSLRDVLSETGFAVYPDLLSGLIDGTKYPEVKAALLAAGNRWDAASIYDFENDTLKIDWGVNAQEPENREAYFYQAFAEATKGLKPLLLALFANRAFNPATVTGLATASALGGLVTLNISLTLGATGNRGYANFFLPIYEMLGVGYTPVASIEGSQDVAYIFEQILAPIFAFTQSLSNQPVDKILGFLPGLVYALSFNMVPSLLNMLATDITYAASANLVGNVLSDSASIAIGDMLDLNDLGIDLSGGINTLLKSFDIDIPDIDQAKLATLGELQTFASGRKQAIYSDFGTGASYDGRAYRIAADKADVGYYLLSYLIDVIKDENAFNALLTTFSTLFAGEEEPEEGEDPPAEGEDQFADIKTLIYETLNLDEADKGDAIAAIVELFNQEEKDLREYDWYDGLTGGTVEGLTPASVVYLSYTNDWTREKAVYLADNFEGVIESIIRTAGGDTDISDAFTELVANGLYTNKNITGLAKLLGGIELDQMLLDILNNELGLDLAAFAVYADLPDDYNWGFEDGDSEGFVNALLALLAPAKDVLGFILDGEDLTLIDSAVTLIGYDGFNNAFVPVLEALGCDLAAVAGEDSLDAILHALVARIDLLCANPVDEILNLIPGVIYFLAGNELSTAVHNLLVPVYALLDTIRPIYDIDLEELINGLLEENELEFTLDLDFLTIRFVLELIGNLVGLDLSELEKLMYDVSKVIGVDYVSASDFVGTGKMGAYIDGTFDKADMVTVVLSFVIEWMGEGNNADDLDALVGTDGLFDGILDIFEGTPTDIQVVDWLYFPGAVDIGENDYAFGVHIPATHPAFGYPNNWTEETAQYVDAELDEIVALILSLTGGEYENLTELINDKVTIYSSENVQRIVDVIADLLANLDDELLDAAGLLLDVDVAALRAYEVPADIDNAEEFATALADYLGTIDGLVKWVFFGDDYRFAYDSDGTDAIVIYGAEGYNKGLGVLLEALGCENLPTTYSETAVYEVLISAFNRLDEIFADPVAEVFEILPNLIYFINAGGATASVNNTLSAVTAFLTTLEGVGVQLDLRQVILDAINLDINDITIESLFTLVGGMVEGLDLTPVTEVINDEFMVGTIQSYMSVSGEYAYKMKYDSEFARYDMLTLIFTVVVEVLGYAPNEAVFTDLFGADVYQVIVNFLNLQKSEMQDMSWLYTDKVGKVLSPINSSVLYKNFEYGPIFTPDKSQYIADNSVDFVDKLVYLLGLEVNGVQTVDLKSLLNNLLDGYLYTNDMCETILVKLQSLSGAVDGLADGAGVHINAVLDRALGIDLNYWTDYQIGTVNDRASFTAEIIRMLSPFYPALHWLLADGTWSFFVDEDGNNLITLYGAEGYAYGIIPALEALNCEGILTPAEYYAAIETDPNVMVTSILNPVLDKVDEILASDDAAEEILALLPPVIYFINSNGLDTCFKNILNAVYTVLHAIEPVAVVDIYDLLGINFADLDFETIFDLLLGKLETSTGIDFSGIDMDAVKELTNGKVVKFTSKNGLTAYTMEYAAGPRGSDSDMVTSVMRLMVTFIATDDNVDKLLQLLEQELGMNEVGKKYIGAVLKTICSYVVDTSTGMDQALAAIYYVFTGLDIAVEGTSSGINVLNDYWQQILIDLGKSDDPNEITVGNFLAALLDEVAGGVFDSEGIASNGLIAFFQKIIAFFQRILDFFRNLGR